MSTSHTQKFRIEYQATIFPFKTSQISLLLSSSDSYSKRKGVKTHASPFKTSKATALQ